MSRRSNDLEMPVNFESEPIITSSELLHFGKHQMKGDPVKGENSEALGLEGMMAAFEHGKKREGVSDTAVAFGSEVGVPGNERSVHTALMDLAGALGIEGVTGKESLEELKHKINQHDKRVFGSRAAIDTRLGFVVKNASYKQENADAIRKKQLLRYLIEQSDATMLRENILEDYSYTRAAGSLAEVVKKYALISKRWDELANDPQKNYGKVLERFLGSHSGIVDSFLLRLVEKLKGPNERDKLIEALGNGKGLEHGEEFDIRIDKLTGRDEPRIRVIFQRKAPDGETVTYHLDEEVPLEVLDELIADKNLLNAKIQSEEPGELT